MTDALQKIFERSLVDIAKEQGYDRPELQITPIYSGGANYTSQLFLAKMSAPGKKQLNMFAKVANVGETFRTQMPVQIFNMERFAYTELSNIYDRIQRDHKVPEEHRLAMPKMYGYDDTIYEEIIVLQDLSAEGFATYDRLKSIDWAYASGAVEQLAKFHALSIALKAYHQDVYDKATVTLKSKTYSSDDPIMQSMAHVVSKSVQLTREENRERLDKFMKQAMSEEFLRQFYEPLRIPVIVHGDFRMSNIMHRENEDGKLDVVVVDYQTLHVGSVISDLLYFIFTGSDAEFRRKHYHQLIEHYYENLCDALRRLNLNPEKAFPREDFDYELKENLSLGLILAVFTLPLVTVASENAPVVGEDMSMESMLDIKTSTLCEDRLNGVVDDYIRWGLL